jgi:tetratricopeptide (TPR) repeat protein
MRPPAASRSFWIDDQRLIRLVRFTIALAVIVGIMFGGYYYWDRYVHLGDKSPIELTTDHLEQKVLENPQDAELRVALANVYLKDGMPDQAIVQVQPVVDNYPEADEAVIILGLAYTQLGEVQSAVSYLERFVEIRQQSPMAAADPVLETALYYLGQNYLTQHQIGKAENVLRKALEIDRTDADAIYLLGQVYDLQDKPQLAIDQYHQAVRFVPDFSEAYQAMGVSYTAMGENDYANYALGAEAFSLKNYSQALEYLLSSVEALPDFAPALTMLGLTYEQLGDLDLASEYLGRALEYDPGSYLAEHALGRVMATLGTNK